MLYAVDMNHMRERHLDGTVLMRSSSGGSAGVFESLLRPDLLITDAERASVTAARRKDRDAALLGKSDDRRYFLLAIILMNRNRLYFVRAELAELSLDALRCQYSGTRVACAARPTLELFQAQVPDMFHAQKEYCFRAMEQDAFPRFLRAKAFGNLTPASALVRLVLGLVILWIGLATAFSLVFLDIQPKSKRFFVSSSVDR